MEQLRRMEQQRRLAGLLEQGPQANRRWLVVVGGGGDLKRLAAQFTTLDIWTDAGVCVRMK